MSASSGKDDEKSTSEGGLPVDKVHDLVREIKALPKGDAHARELDSHLTKIENELAREEPHYPTLTSLLDELRSLSAGATERLRSSGAMTLINEILGTGVPPT